MVLGTSLAAQFSQKSGSSESKDQALLPTPPNRPWPRSESVLFAFARHRQGGDPARRSISNDSKDG